MKKSKITKKSLLTNETENKKYTSKKMISLLLFNEIIKIILPER